MLDCCRTLLDQWRMVTFFTPKRSRQGRTETEHPSLVGVP